MSGAAVDAAADLREKHATRDACSPECWGRRAKAVRGLHGVGGYMRARYRRLLVGRTCACSLSIPNPAAGEAKSSSEPTERFPRLSLLFYSRSLLLLLTLLILSPSPRRRQHHVVRRCEASAVRVPVRRW